MFPRLRKVFGFEFRVGQRERLRQHIKVQARLLLEPLEDRWVPALTYHGGPLIANVQIEAIYYSPWNSDSTLMGQKATLDSYFTFITNSTYMDLLSQYSVPGTTIGKGSFSGDDSNFPTAATTTVTINGVDYNAIDDSQIESDLSTEINAGNNKLTAPNTNTVYFVFTPPGVVVTASGIGNSVENFVGYHNWFFDSTSSSDVVYAVMPYSDFMPNANFFALPVLQNLEEVASHEMAEAITDPFVGSNLPGWFDDASGGEVGDLSSRSYSTLNGFVVQSLFSNATNLPMIAAGTSFYISSFQNTTEGQFTGVVATFVDTSGKGVLSSALVIWGDGGANILDSPMVQRVNSTTFELIASHTYVDLLDEGAMVNPLVLLTLADGSQAGDTGVVYITDSNGMSHSYTDKGLVTLMDPAVVGNPVSVTATAGTAFSGGVATFTDPAGAEANDGVNYVASINWGDNTADTTGTITFSNGVFTVSGNHTYGTQGSFMVTCTINHEGIFTTVMSQVMFVATPPPTVTPPANQNAAEGANPFTLGSFTDANKGPWTVTVAWGDGTQITLSPPTTGSLGSQTHIYVEEGTYTVTITVTDTGDSRSASTTFQAIVSDPAVVATSMNLTAVEGTAFSSQAVATFTDPGGAEPNDGSSYFATIDWGDGNLTFGTITQSGGTFTVSGDHTYVEEGSYQINVTIVHDNAPNATVTGSATVSDPAVLATGLDIFPQEGQPVVVLGGTTWVEAQFTDPSIPELPGTTGDYTATINWGDGTTSMGNIIEDPTTAVFSVVGNHTYGEEGSYRTTVIIGHDKAPSVTVTGSATVSDPAVVDTPMNVSATLGTPFSGALATFTDPGGAEPNDGTHYTASIDWGDKTTPTTGTIMVTGGTFTVSGNHTYAAAGSYTITCTINHEGVLTTVTSQATVTAAPPPTVTPPANQNAAEGAANSFGLGSFTDSSHGPWTVTVAWGDGTQVTLTPTTTEALSNQSHTYAEEGTYTVTVTVSDTGSGQSGSATYQVVVSDPAVIGTPVNVSATAGTSFSGAVATFADPGGAEPNAGDPNPNNISGHYNATIDWGDKTTPTTGTITLSGSTFTVSGNHVYATSGPYTIICTINHETVITTVQSPATVAGVTAPVVTAPANQNGIEGAANSFGLGNFADASSGPWTVTVAWGDSTQISLTPTATGSLGSQSHTYAEEGTYTVTLTVSNTGNGQSGSATYQVVVADPAVVATPASVSATAGASFNGAVASFTDPGGAEANDGTHYSASIDWGDKTTPTTGTITLGGSTFTVSGNHTYATSGSYTIICTINHETVMTTVQSVATVAAAAPVVTAPASQNGIEGAANSFGLGSFTDASNGSWTVTVAWGDGTQTTLTPTTAGSLGSQSHTYGEEGTYTVTVTVADSGDGKAGSASYQVTVSDPAVMGTSVNVSATAGASFSGAVATFTDPGGAEANDGTHYSASIDWGDKTTPTTGTISFSGGVFTISGSHTYAAAGSFTVTSTINHEGITTTVTSPATVIGATPPVVTTPPNENAAEGAANSLSLGSFSDSSNGPWTVTVAWGDGTQTTLTPTMTGSLGSQNHTFGEEGTYTVTVTVADSGDSKSGSATYQVVVSDPAVVGTPANVGATALVSFSGTVATFTDAGGAEPNGSDPNPGSISGHYSASIDWGDKTTPTTGTITLSGSTFTVSGNHIYAAAGSFTITCTINHEGVVTTVKSPATVAEPPPPTVTAPASQNAAEGAANSFGLGSFSDLSSGPWTGTIAWGDGTQTTITPTTTGSLGSQSHTYAEEGSYTVTVTVTNTGDGESGSAAYHVAVSDPAVAGNPVNVPVTAGTPFSGAVASFTDPGGTEPLTSYSATINWGDGSASATGTISASGGVFTVSGSHTYAAAGSYTITTTINHETVLTNVLSPAVAANLGSFVVPQMVKGILFWQSAQGQQLIGSFGRTSIGLTLGQWLATTFANLYGGVNGSPNLSAFSNAQVAAFDVSLFNRFGTQLDAEVLATALNVFATTASLGGTTAQAYGFTVNAYGLGASSWSIGLAGPAFGVPNNTTLNVYQILMAANNAASSGEPWNSAAPQGILALGVFKGVNGDVP